MKPTILNTKEIAQYLNVSQDTIYKMVRARQIPYFRIRGKLAFNVESIDQWRFESEKKLVDTGDALCTKVTF